jgi:hypothetical protein
MSLPNLKKLRAEEAATLALVIEEELASARRRLLVRYDARSVERVFDDVQRKLERNLRLGIITTVERVRELLDEAVGRQTKGFPFLIASVKAHSDVILGSSVLTFMALRNHLIRARETMHQLLLLGERDAGYSLLRGRNIVVPGVQKSNLADVRDLLPRVRALGTSAVINTAHTTHRDIMVAAPQVRAVQWMLSTFRGSPKYRPDECDILALQDFYGLGPGVYPVDKVPNLPHLNDLCYLRSVTRPFAEFGEPKPNPGLVLTFPTTLGVESLGPGMQMRARARAWRVVLAAHTG